jgi:molybdopterin/thiamine biosynthesis adenylyltransferase
VASKPEAALASLQAVPELVEEPQAEQEIVSRDFDVDSAGVKDRWSRYIGAMGIDAVRRQTTSSVFISGLRGLGIEIAKNIVLSGVKRLSIQDSEAVTV